MLQKLVLVLVLILGVVSLGFSYSIHPNGVTVLCGDEIPGSTFVYNTETYYVAHNMTDIQANINGTIDGSSFTGTYPAGNICTSHVTDMNPSSNIGGGIFDNQANFNQDISSWDVSNVIQMTAMFRGASSFNSDLSNWDTSSVTRMYSMFWGASSFSSDLSNWDVSSVTDMGYMFTDATNFNSNLNSWNVSSVRGMSFMFRDASSFNSNLSSWDVSNVTHIYGMREMFYGASSFNGDLSSWDVSSVTNMGLMFRDASSFNGNLSSWDVSSVTNMRFMFRGASSFSSDLSNWNVSRVTNMEFMFSGASSFSSDLSSWNVSSVTDMSNMFTGASSFNGNLSSWDVSSVIDMDSMFFGASSFNQDLSYWCVENITTEPTNFATSSPLDSNGLKPVWGTCPQFIFEAQCDGGSGFSSCDSLIYGNTVSGVNISCTPLISSTDSISFEVIHEESSSLVYSSTNSSLTSNYSLFYPNFIIGGGTYIFNYSCSGNDGNSTWENDTFFFLPGKVNITRIQPLNYQNTLPLANDQINFSVEVKCIDTYCGNVSTSLQHIDLSVMDQESFELGFGIWNNVAYDSSYDWSRDAFGTPSSSTGPSSGSEGDYYIYTEASGIYSTDYTLESIDLSSYPLKNIVFDYHMYGSSMGNLALEYFDGSVWNQLWSLSGDQGNQWFEQEIDLSFYSIEKLRFVGITGTSYRSDISLDNIRLFSETSEVLNSTSSTFLTSSSNPAFNSCLSEMTLGDSCIVNWTIIPNEVTLGKNFTLQIQTNQTGVLNSTPITSLSFTSLTTDFISHWDVSIDTGSTGYGNLQLPMVESGTYNYTVFWGDGTSSEVTSWNDSDAFHNYNENGEYTVLVRGEYDGWAFNQDHLTDNLHDGDKLIDISQWGNLKLANTGRQFAQTGNLQGFSATDTLNISHITNMYAMFANSNFNQDISDWNVSSVTVMNQMFRSAINFNQPLDNFDTSSVTDMMGMFAGASSFNQPLDNFDTSLVTNMEAMFAGASSFNQLLDNFDTSSVTDMTGMFAGASSFNQPLDNFDTSNVLTLTSFFGHPDFGYASSFNQSLDNFNTSSVTDMSYMFDGASSFNQPLDNFDTSSVTDMEGMFAGASSFNQPLDNFDTSSVTDMRVMFSYASSFNQPLDNFNTSSVTSMRVMFSHASSFNQPLDNFDTSSVTDMGYMFYSASSFNQPLDNFNTSLVTDMSYMFDGASSFNQDLSSWCVPLIGSEPSEFATSSPLDEEYKPLWGTCPIKHSSLFFQCDVGSGMEECSSLNYREILESVRVSCTPFDGNSISNVSFSLINLDYSQVLINETLTSSVDGYWPFLTNMYIPSGKLKFEVSCSNSLGEVQKKQELLFIDYGTLGVQLITPNRDTSYPINSSFTMTSRVECIGGDCGDVEFALDPIEFSPEPKLGTTTFDSCITQDSGDQIEYIQISSNSLNILNVTLSIFPSSSGTYTTNNGIHYKVFLYNSDSWNEIYSVVNTSVITDVSYLDSFLFDVSNLALSGENYLRASLIDRGSTDDFLIGNCADSDSGSGSGSGRHFDNADVSFTYLESTKGGIIPMNSGSPFYTTSQNPDNQSACLKNMISGDSCELSWLVFQNGTRVNDQHIFFTFANSLNYSSQIPESMSEDILVTILNQLPANFTYTQKNPQNNSKLMKEELFFQVDLSGQTFTDCELDFNGSIYSMDYSYPYSQINLSSDELPRAITNITYQVTCNSGAEVLEQREFTFYPVPENTSILPAFGLLSALFSLFVLSFFFTRTSKSKKAIVPVLATSLLLLVTATSFVVLTGWYGSFQSSMETKELYEQPNSLAFHKLSKNSQNETILSFTNEEGIVGILDVFIDDTSCDFYGSNVLDGADLLQLELSCPVEEGKIYSVKVFTSDKNLRKSLQVKN